MRFSKAAISSVYLSVRPMSSRPSMRRMRSAAGMSKAMSGPPGPVMRWASRSTVNGADPSTSTTRAMKGSVSCGPSTTGSNPFCLQNGLLPVVLGPQDTDPFIARVVEVDGSAPFTVDLEAQRITGPGGPDIAFDIPAADRMRLIEGLDDIGLTLKYTDEIAAFEKRMAGEQPWLQAATDSRV